MINRSARNKAADALEELVEGAISNAEYERRFPTPRPKEDPALQAIFLHVWLFYSDTYEHRLTGDHALTDATRKFLRRCILFLRSDLEFQWPLPKLTFFSGILRGFGFGRLLEGREQEEMSVGDMEVWPFLRKADYSTLLHDQAGSQGDTDEKR
jgi:hypothetical protein